MFFHRNPTLGVWCAFLELRQAARGGGNHYQLSFAWLLRMLSSINQAQKSIVQKKGSQACCISVGLVQQDRMGEEKHERTGVNN